MALSKIDIYNLTLFNIGHTKRVLSPTEDSAERRNCEAIYEQSKRGLLTMADWNFAKTSVAMSLTGYTPKGWAYEYFYPSGCVKALEIARASSESDPIPFQTALRYNETTGAEDRVVWTDEEGAELIHLRDVQSPTVFTPKFVDTLSHYMGIPLARVMAKNKSTVDDMSRLFQYHIGEAIRSGEAEAQDKKALDASWIRER